MSSSSPQFTLYSHAGGPNPWKVAIVLEELGLADKTKTVFLDFASKQHKAPDFTKYNPNGRVPALVDHSNNDFVLWESNAILDYLVLKYDTKHLISVEGIENRALQTQWLFFQASGQGPYYGQAVWFNVYHAEKLPSAVERYRNEALRVTQVLEDVLKVAPNNVLVGGKVTIADLSFITWQNMVPFILGDKYNAEEFKTKFPTVVAWLEKLKARPAVAKVLAAKAAVEKH